MYDFIGSNRKYNRKRLYLQLRNDNDDTTYIIDILQSSLLLVKCSNKSQELQQLIIVIIISKMISGKYGSLPCCYTVANGVNDCILKYIYYITPYVWVPAAFFYGVVHRLFIIFLAPESVPPFSWYS